MIKLTYMDINNRLFIDAVKKLMIYDQWGSAQLKYNIHKIGRRLSDESDVAQAEYLKLVKQHAELDEKGDIVPVSPEQPGTFVIKTEKEEVWKTARADFEAVTFEIDCHPVPLSKLDLCPLSPQDVGVLEPLLDIAL